MHLHLVDAIGALAVLGLPATLLGLAGEPAPRLDSAPTVTVAATVLDYPEPGEFLIDGRPAASPARPMDVTAFSIMKHQVSLAEYERCVADDACSPPDAASANRAADVPVTGVSFLDAEAYARWYSQATGKSWRLPTAPEAAAAAAERFVGDAFSAIADDPANPAVRWLRRYREEAAARRAPDSTPKSRGHYGANSLGLEDFGGNVWEWTATCHTRVTLDADTGAVEAITPNCGVHVLEGRHRASMSNFVRDGRSGGCAVGTPPENLGFRLVREDPPSGLAALRAYLGGLI